RKQKPAPTSSKPTVACARRPPAKRVALVRKQARLSGWRGIPMLVLSAQWRARGPDTPSTASDREQVFHGWASASPEDPGAVIRRPGAFACRARAAESRDCRLISDSCH